MPRVKLLRRSEAKQLDGKCRCPSHVELPPIGLPLAIGAVCPVTRVQPPALSEGGSRSISPRSSANRSSWLSIRASGLDAYGVELLSPIRPEFDEIARPLIGE